MATSSRNAGVLAIQVVLGIVIVVLSYFLYHAIRDPYLAVERAEQMTQVTRDRMDQVRIALRVYNERNKRFPSTLDSLVQFVNTNVSVTSKVDSLFGSSFNADSFYVSPRPPHSRFEYAVNDTSRVKIYMLKDPDTDDQIGTLQPDITQVHAASWE
jgi:hypothetical protein